MKIVFVSSLLFAFFNFGVAATANELPKAFYALDCGGNGPLISSQRYHWEKKFGIVLPKSSERSVTEARWGFNHILVNRWTSRTAYFTKGLESSEPEQELERFDWHKDIWLQPVGAGLPEREDNCKVVPTAILDYSGYGYIGSTTDFHRMSPLDQWIQVMVMKGLDEDLIRTIYADSITKALTLKELIEILKKYRISESFSFRKQSNSDVFELKSCEWWNDNVPKECYVKEDVHLPWLTGKVWFWPNGYLREGRLQGTTTQGKWINSSVRRHQDPQSTHHATIIYCRDKVTYRENGSLSECGGENYPDVI